MSLPMNLRMNMPRDSLQKPHHAIPFLEKAITREMFNNILLHGSPGYTSHMAYRDTNSKARVLTSIRAKDARVGFVTFFTYS